MHQWKLACKFKPLTIYDTRIKELKGVGIDKKLGNEYWLAWGRKQGTTFRVLEMVYKILIPVFGQIYVICQK